MFEMRKSLRSASLMPLTAASPTRTVPSAGVRMPAMRFRSVVFPDPLGPMTATFSGAETESSGTLSRKAPVP
jgi:hypothetical protein